MKLLEQFIRSRQELELRPSSRSLFRFIFHQLEVLMSAFDNLGAQVTGVEASEASLSGEVTTALADIATEIQSLKAAGADPAKIDAITARLQAVSSKLGADQASVQAADPGAPAPPPPPPTPAPPAQP